MIQSLNLNMMFYDNVRDIRFMYIGLKDRIILFTQYISNPRS